MSQGTNQDQPTVRVASCIRNGLDTGENVEMSNSKNAAKWFEDLYDRISAIEMRLDIHELNLSQTTTKTDENAPYVPLGDGNKNSGAIATSGDEDETV